MRVPMIVLAAACVAIGLSGPLVVGGLGGAAASAAGLPPSESSGLEMAAESTRMVVLGATVFLLLVGALFLVRRRVIAGRVIRTVTTWDCGYAAPNARMQYTASGFAQPLTSLFRLRFGRIVTRRRPQASSERSALSTHADPMLGESTNPPSPAWARCCRGSGGCRAADAALHFTSP
jgi:hypothetical protein